RAKPGRLIADVDQLEQIQVEVEAGAFAEADGEVRRDVGPVHQQMQGRGCSICKAELSLGQLQQVTVLGGPSASLDELEDGGPQGVECGRVRQADTPNQVQPTV